MAHMSPDKLMRLKFPLSRRTRTNYACMPSFLGRKTHRPTYFLAAKCGERPGGIAKSLDLIIYIIYLIYTYIVG